MTSFAVALCKPDTHLLLPPAPAPAPAPAAAAAAAAPAAANLLSSSPFFTFLLYLHHLLFHLTLSIRQLHLSAQTMMFLLMALPV